MPQVAGLGTTAPEVLVVDDEIALRDVVGSAFQLAEFTVSVAASGTEALAQVRARSFDLIVLDVMLPDRSGFEVVEAMRAEGRHVPVLFLTARSDGASAARGLTIGGDDYLRKPFDIDELLARAFALLRRSRATPETTGVASFRDVIVDTNAVVARRGDRVLDLTPTEFRLLDVLVRHSGRVLTKWQIVDQVWEHPLEVDPSTVETVVSRLRRKLDGPTDTALLVTRRGVGYGLLDERT